MEKIALTLPGGGARAAYQAGVLKAISDICKFNESPFKIISGISAGGINGMWVAAGAKDFKKSTHELWDLWQKISVSDVYKTDTLTLLQTGATWVRNLSLGEWFGKSHITYLLDTSPLGEFLKRKINFPSIRENLETGLIYGLSLSTTDYHSGMAVTFISGDKALKPWSHSLSSGQRAELTLRHVLASAAIPIFFPPVHIDGHDYGDGGIGLKTPLSPAIHMGASRILIIGVQNPKSAEIEKKASKNHGATIGDVSGTLLNSLFLNSLDGDIERLQLLNRTVSIFTPEQLKSDVDHLRAIPMLLIRPSKDLSCVGAKELAHFPFTIRHVLKGLGITDQKGWDLLSYLAFDTVYSATLLELGYNDAIAIKADVLKFFKI